MIEVTLTHPTVGNDPEFFLMSKRKTPIAAEKFFPSKSHVDKPSIYYDNVAVELNVPPSTCLQTINNYIGAEISKLVTRLTVAGIDIYPERVSFRSAEKISKITMEKYASTREFACHPSLCYKEGDIEIRHPEVDPTIELRRSAGFHVHIGVEESRIESLVFNFIRLCDLLVGIPGVLVEKDDTERVLWRRQVLGYGVAGEFRIQPHWYEYRTLGAWPLSHPFWTWWANASVRGCHMVAEALDKSKKSTDLLAIDRAAIVNTINTNNYADAKAIWQDTKKILSKEFILTKHNSTTFLSSTNIASFDFLLLNGGLTLINSKSFFDIWTELQNRNDIVYESAYWGASNLRLKILNKIGFETFHHDYNITNDYLL